MNEAALVCDFRSDTVTRPTDAMRRAMAGAEVGDDVFGDDPTVAALESLAAKMVGKEAALFVPSGTMGNQIALQHATRPGDEAIVEASSHMLLFEVGGAARLSGVQLRAVRGCAGVLDLAQVDALVRDPRDLHQPRTSFLAVEQTHNMAGGTVVPVEHLAALRERCDRHGLHFHMDGARVFNATAATGLPVTELTRHVDSVMFCLSKGLGAPIGSILAGSEEAVRSFRRIRKVLGGGMRQAGIIAAAGIVALEERVGRLAQDHVRARRLAEGVAGLPAARVDPDSVQTNMVFLHVDGGDRAAECLEARLDRRGVRGIPLPGGILRFVLHADVGDEHVERAIEVVREELAAAPSGAGGRT